MMRIAFPPVVCVAGLLVAGALPTAAQAQVPAAPAFARVSISTSNANIRVQTTVTVPDGGSVLLGGYSRVSEGRKEFGTPGLGRGFRNVGYGRSARGVSVRAAVRIINLREEEYRQTGFRSP
jgi:hypothetical protein